MHAPTDNAAPPRSALTRLLLRSWDYRLPSVFAGARFAAGTWLVVLCVILLAYGHWWSALLLVAAAPLLWVGYQDMTIARSAPPRTWPSPLPSRRNP
jgi:hypothetical protein